MKIRAIQKSLKNHQSDHKIGKLANTIYSVPVGSFLGKNNIKWACKVGKSFHPYQALRRYNVLVDSDSLVTVFVITDDVEFNNLADKYALESCSKARKELTKKLEEINGKYEKTVHKALQVIYNKKQEKFELNNIDLDIDRINKLINELLTSI